MLIWNDFCCSKPDLSHEKLPLMKNFYFLVLLIIPQLSLPGQTGTDFSVTFEIKKINFKPAGEINKFITLQDNELIKPDNLQDTIYRRLPDRSKNGRFFIEPGKRFHHDFRIPEKVETYPGAPKFYRKSRPMPSPYEKSFIIPYTASWNQKYHLIIKDPITGRIIN